MAKAEDAPLATTKMEMKDASTTDSFKWRTEIQTLEKYFKGNESKSQTMRWLTRLRLLEPIPFQYLVPSEDMLPSETIRYFHIDRNWVDALIDGALSVTLTSTRERQWLLKEMDDGKTRYSSLMEDLDVAENLADEYRNYVTSKSNSTTSTKQVGSKLTGFLFRSSVVRDYPGLEITGYRSENRSEPWEDKNQVSIHRFARLSESIIMVIFNGCPTHIRFQEPAEGIRIGVDGDANQYELKLKNPDGTLLANGMKINVNKRSYGDKSVIDVLGLYDSLIDKMDSGHLSASFDQQESALIATQMLQYPYQQDFVPYSQMQDGSTPHPHKDAINWGGDD